MPSLTPAYIQASAAVLALLLAAITIFAGRRVQREQTARKAHLDYLNIAMANPSLAVPVAVQIRDAAGQLFMDGADPKFEQYEWFVGYMLSTASYVWESVGTRHPLYELMVLQVAYHWKYLQTYRNERDYLKIWFKKYDLQLERGIDRGKTLKFERPVLANNAIQA
jgi:hypothetical protein